MAQILNRKPLGKRSGIDPSDRRRSWLDAYENTRWELHDSIGIGKSKYINFDVRMADGRSLLDHAELYATAKELLFWIRAGTFTQINDAYRHSQYGQTLLRLCYGLTARGIYSFRSLTTVDIDLICEEAAFGVDGLTRSSLLTREGLALFHSWADVPSTLQNSKGFDLKKVKNVFKLPLNWARKEIATEVEAATARLNGKTIVSIPASMGDDEDEPITAQNIHLVTNLFEASFALRDFIEAPTLTFRPFPEGASKRASDLGRVTTRTPVPPPELAMRLLENTTRYFASQYEHILTTYHAIEKTRGTEEWSVVRSLEVGSQVRSLSVACFILIAAFTARRAEEIKVLERDCLNGNDKDGYWLRVYIEKNGRELTWIPIPALVARAVEGLRALTPDNEGAPDGGLFQYREPRSGKIAQLSPENHLNEFAESIGAIEYSKDNEPTFHGDDKAVANGNFDGASGSKKPERWNWQTRQFRRLFAVMFFYRYRGKIETLAHHLRHFDSRMTNDYVTKDPEIAKVWDQEVWRYQVDIGRDIVSGRVTYSGAMGKRLTQLVERLRKKFIEKVQIVPEELGAVVVRKLRKGQFVLTPKLWVTCSCPRTRNACEKAACRKAAGYGPEDHGPDFSAAGPTVCPDCPFAMIGPENIVYMDEELGRAKASAVAAAADGPTIFAELQAANVLKLTGVVNDLKAA